MLVTQTNPYHALVIRAILGAVAALVYAVLGAADVALTEALVGTMLAVTLYIIAVRSSLIMRLGVLAEANEENFAEAQTQLKEAIEPYHLRLEVVPYEELGQLKKALLDKEVHGICWQDKHPQIKATWQLNLRIDRLYRILEEKLASSFFVVGLQEEPSAESDIAKGNNPEISV